MKLLNVRMMENGKCLSKLKKGSTCICTCMGRFSSFSKSDELIRLPFTTSETGSVLNTRLCFLVRRWTLHPRNTKPRMIYMTAKAKSIHFTWKLQTAEFRSQIKLIYQCGEAYRVTIQLISVEAAVSKLISYL